MELNRKISPPPQKEMQLASKHFKSFSVGHQRNVDCNYFMISPSCSHNGRHLEAPRTIEVTITTLSCSQ